MIVHQTHQSPLFKLRKLTSSQHKVKKVIIAGLILSNLFFGCLVLFFGRQKISLLIRQITGQVLTQANSISYRLNPPPVEHLDIDIPFENWQQIVNKRHQALEDGVLITSDDDFVTAELRTKEQKLPIKIRLKGDWTDHLENSKWSFRVQIKNNQTYMGMRYFSLQDPQTRVMANEWLFYQALRQAGLIALRYDLVDVSVNGEHKGIYAIEEHFSKELIENNQRREGPIIKFSEDRLWQINLAYEFQEGLEDGLAWQSPIEPFKENQIANSPELAAEFNQALSLLENYRHGRKQAAEVFDIDSWAKFYALSDVFNVKHGLQIFNIRLYYNPITGLIEPVAYDNQIEGRTYQLSIESDTLHQNLPGLFEDHDFQAHYLSYLNQYSQKTYLDNLFDQLDQKLSRITKLLNYDQIYNFTPEIFYQNQKFIRQKLTELPAVQASLNNHHQLELFALTELPVQVLFLSDNHQQIVVDWTKEPSYIPRATRQAVPEIVQLPLPDNVVSDLSSSGPSEYQITYRLLGLNEEHQVPLRRWIIDETDSRLTQASIQKPGFVIYSPSNNSYIVPAGQWQLSRDWQIDSGAKLVFNAGASLDLTQNATLVINHGSVDMNGEADAPIHIYSSDKTGGGLVVMNSHDISQIWYTFFDGLASPQTLSQSILGSVTFYQSPVAINQSQFSSNSSEDGLNIVRSKFEIENSKFTQTASDAFDADFSTGSITNTIFIHTGNDAIDVSGSQVEISNVSIVQAGDKGISAGEVSRVQVEETTISDSNIGFASKDNSELTIRLGKIENTKLGFAVYQKKPEYGPARLIDWNTTINNLEKQWLIEKNSILTYNGNDYIQNEENVYQQVLDL